MVFKSCSNSFNSDGTSIEVASLSDNGLPVFGFIEFFFLFQTKELNSTIFSVYFSQLTQIEYYENVYRSFLPGLLFCFGAIAGARCQGL